MRLSVGGDVSDDAESAPAARWSPAFCLTNIKLMIRASMLEFARTGDFGPLRAGVTRKELRELLGAPPLWGTQQNVDRADIWRYGDIEYHFDNATVSIIFSDHENLTDGGSTLKVDPWVIRRGLPRIEFEILLEKQDVRFTVHRCRYDDSQCHVTTDSGVAFLFVDEPENQWDEAGLVSWSKRIRQNP